MAKLEEVDDKEAKRQLSRFRAQVEEDAEEHLQAYLNITPMMDMMTILLVFLLKQFSVQAAAASMADGLQLPASTVETTRPLAVNVTVSQNAILVEGDAVAPVRAGAIDASIKRDGANGYYITPLVDTLNKHANRLKKIAAMGGTVFDGTAMIMVDKATPYRLLTEILYSAGQAEFRNYHLVVIKRGQ
jgi:biopolymer transport protein ExbD